MDYLAKDNIIVCSSGHIANVAISKIRLSGRLDLPKLNQFFSKDLTKLKTRYANYVEIVHEGQIIDDVICIIFKAPHSYTGEDLIELDVHGSVLNVKRILDLFIDNAGFRLAEPGEFSYRALKNKKLTLSQVEGLDLILNATSIYSLEQGRSLVSGKIRRDFEELHQKYLAHKSAVELSIDFLDDIGDDHADKMLQDTLGELHKSIKKLYSHVSSNSNSILAPQISLLGEPNAGKSTFFNLLLKDERSIVSDIAGTTRDYVSESIFFKNILFRLVDTAGLRESTDAIESIGVERSFQVASESFINVLVVNPFIFKKENFSKVSGQKIDLLVFTHLDQKDYQKRLSAILPDIIDTIGPIEPLQNYGSIGPEFFEKNGPMGAVNNGPIEPNISGPMGAKASGPIEPMITIKYIELGRGEEVELENFIEYIVAKYQYLVKNEPFLVARHSELIENLRDSMETYVSLVTYETDISIISQELNLIGNCISELIGIVSPDDVLRNIFENFCIGK